MCDELEDVPDKTINLSLIKSRFEMMDLRDWVAVRENFGIKSDDINIKK